MLKGISPLLSPELLAAMYRMGHGDVLVLADAHFPGHSLGVPVIRADGLNITQVLEAILPLYPVDTYVEAPLVMMAPVQGDRLDPAVEAAYRNVLDRYEPQAPPITRVERFDFYEQARVAFVVVMTGETRQYGNIMIRKGVVPAYRQR
ncbi:MAG: L-fucose mutarotase [Phycisphaeraceae bacterium]|nr:L-fucose mutarotase [Phycisphaeraceae bacterium]